MTDQPDISALADAVRESGIALKPGDVLAVRLPMSFNGSELQRAGDYAKLVEADTGIKVAFVPGEEFAHTTVNIHVTVSETDPGKLTAEIQRQIHALWRSPRRAGTRGSLTV